MTYTPLNDRFSIIGTKLHLTFTFHRSPFTILPSLCLWILAPTHSTANENAFESPKSNLRIKVCIIPTYLPTSMSGVLLKGRVVMKVPLIRSGDEISDRHFDWKMNMCTRLATSSNSYESHEILRTTRIITRCQYEWPPGSASVWPKIEMLRVADHRMNPLFRRYSVTQLRRILRSMTMAQKND